MKSKGIILRLKDTVQGGRPDNPPITFTIEKLRPFTVTATQEGKTWVVNMKPSEFIELLLISQRKGSSEGISQSTAWKGHR